MALFESKYQELTFYVDGKAHSFRHGQYKTEDSKEIAVLTKLADVHKVAEPEKPTQKTTTKTKK